MDENENKFIKNGTFSVSPTHKVNGNISLNGADSVLHLWSDNRFNVDVSEIKTITGILNNQKKVSLIECIKIQESRFFGDEGFSLHQKFFPHYVIIGNRYFSHSEEIISYVSFVVDDATILFDDRESFGTVIVDPNEIEKLTTSDILREIPFREGGMPVIAYYTGKDEIFSANTTIGKVSARNLPTFDTGGANGTHIKNKIVVGINFSNPMSVTEMDNRIRRMLRFFEIIVGRPQNLLEVKIIQMDNHPPESSSVYINMYPNRNERDVHREPDFPDILIEGGREPRKFEDLLCAWLERDKYWRNARLRFSEGWAHQRIYDASRIIRAANMFDLLPKQALPQYSPLPSDLESAVSECKDRFKNLPQSLKKNEVLDALGRTKRQSLKQKIRYRSSFLTKSIEKQIPEIDLITDAAVDLRNLYVHGGYPDSRIEKLTNSQIFLTNTLEFIFCASDLVDLGWDIEAWCRKPMLGGHPFCRYLVDYKANLSKFKNL